MPEDTSPGGLPADTGAKPWFDGADPIVVGHIQNRGLADKTPLEAALHFAKAHREAETFIGAPKERLIKLPVDASDEAGWADVWNKMGVPADPKVYDATVATVKFADGQPLAPSYSAALAEAARRNHWTPDTTADVGRTLVKLIEADIQADGAEAKVLLDAQEKALRANWGANYDVNMVLAKNAAANIGIDEAQLSVFESMVGYDKFLNVMLAIGTKVGEDTFLHTALGNRAQTLTREQATARLQELQGDSQWRKRFLDGDVTAVREHANLIEIATPKG